MEVKQFVERIKRKEIKGILKLTSEDRFLLDNSLALLFDSYLGRDPVLNLSKITTPQDLTEFRQVLVTLPMFADYRIVHLKDSGLSSWMTKPEVFAELPETTIVIIEEELDKRTTLSKWLTKHAWTVELEKYGKTDFTKWLSKKMAELKIPVEDASQARIAEHIAVRSGYLAGTARKDKDGKSEESVGLYDVLNGLYQLSALHREVTFEDVDEVFGIPAERSVFELFDSLGSGEALLKFSELIAKEDERKIFQQIGKNFRTMYKARQLQSTGMRENEVSQILGVKEYYVKKSLQNGKKFSLKQLRECIARVEKINDTTKAGGVNIVLQVEELLSYAAACLQGFDKG